MIYYLAEYLQECARAYEWGDMFSWLRIFSYVSFRVAGAALTAFGLSLLLGDWAIARLRKIALEHYVSSENKGADGSVLDPRKKDTPGMGGILIVGVMDVTALLWGQWNELLLLTVFSMIVLCGLGFYDDWKKITCSEGKEGKGLGEMGKIIAQVGLGAILAVYLYKNADLSFLVEQVMVPFCKEPVFTVGWVSTVMGGLIVIFVIFCSSNAVNLTDGLDGLAIGCTLICSLVFLVITYVTGRVDYSAYLNLTYVRGACELTVFCAALCGASLGFLWFNCHPAQVFMGDTGSLAIGGALGIMSVLVHQPFIFFIAGGIFVIEFFSSFLQRYFFKFTRIATGRGRRVFLRAPLHGHFKLKGWVEEKVVIRFYILAIIFAVIALASLKIR